MEGIGPLRIGSNKTHGVRGLATAGLVLLLFRSVSGDVYTFAPRKVRSVCGQVVVESVPIPNMTVKLSALHQDKTHRWTELVSTTTTDSNGRYRFKEVAKGKYWINMESTGLRGATLIELKKKASEFCAELIVTKVKPGRLPEDENTSIEPFRN
jgi:hypothetical protein